MSANPRPRQSCPNQACDYHGVIGKGNIVRHSYLKVKCGRRRRYRCKACGKTFSRNTNTPYHRLHASRNLFDRVAHLSVEGVSISAIARICGRSWHDLQVAVECSQKLGPRGMRVSTGPEGQEILNDQATETPHA